MWKSTSETHQISTPSSHGPKGLGSRAQSSSLLVPFVRLRRDPSWSIVVPRKRFQVPARSPESPHVFQWLGSMMECTGIKNSITHTHTHIYKIIYAHHYGEYVTNHLSWGPLFVHHPAQSSRTICPHQWRLVRGFALSHIPKSCINHYHRDIGPKQSKHTKTMESCWNHQLDPANQPRHVASSQAFPSELLCFQRDGTGSTTRSP